MDTSRVVDRAECLRHALIQSHMCQIPQEVAKADLHMAARMVAHHIKGIHGFERQLTLR